MEGWGDVHTGIPAGETTGRAPLRDVTTDNMDSVLRGSCPLKRLFPDSQERRRWVALRASTQLIELIPGRRAGQMEISLSLLILRKMNRDTTVITVRMVERAAATPYWPRMTSVYIEIDSVSVWTVYRKIVALSSVMIATQVRMAPEMTPGPIIGIVTRKNVFKFEAPRLIDASSTDGLI